MAAPADSWGEKNRMKQSFDDKKIAQVSEMLQIVNERKEGFSWLATDLDAR